MAAAEGDAEKGTDPRLHLALFLTWLAYAYFYVLRKALGAIKSELRSELSYSESQLASLDTAFLGAYSTGLYVSGCLVDALPPRLVLCGGLVIAALASAALPAVLPDGSSDSFVAWLPAYTVWVLHGLAQSAGHPAIQRVLGCRLKGNKHSGMYLGIWTTSQTVGGITGNFCGGHLLKSLGWQSVLQRPATVVPAVVGCLVLGWSALEVTQKHVAIPVPCEPTEERQESRCLALTQVTSGGCSKSGVQCTPQVQIAALAAFFVKFVRYALLFWLPYYNWAVLGFDASKAAYHASMFEFGGFFGSMALGPLSDRLQGTGTHRRAAPSVLLMLVGSLLLGFVCPRLQAMSDWGDAARDFAMLCGIFLVGVSIDGPESVVTGALCNDLCEDHGLSGSVGRVVGMVNGTGILGAMLAGPAVTLWARSCGGWPSVFPFLAIVSMLGSLVLLPLCQWSPVQALLRSRLPALAALAAFALCGPLLLLAICRGGQPADVLSVALDAGEQ